ncbi:hypothetical protein ACFFMN_30415 [Planobispora siamensis]|uniref:Uncharacterized protein n=1 Tax=Planobispora siamensis TaxID=936338 RepID=A0A8J3SGA1_9ACTN|nr:hypothetical protein [Planobispora siamensis]GIH91494.1 hypothetical protein Psi01_21240 [Planobispora siamensis]
MLSGALLVNGEPFPQAAPYVSGDDAQVIGTTTWATMSIPGVRRVHDPNAGGIVATTASRVLVLDHRGETRMSLPIRKSGDGDPEDAYHLRPDGDRFVVIRGPEGRVETFDPATGERLHGVVPVFAGDDFLGAGLGWSEQGPFLVRSALNERVHFLELATGRLWRRDR